MQAKLKFYTTFTLTVVAVTGFSALMFLVPFVVDPALATLTADFIQKPVEHLFVNYKCIWEKCFLPGWMQSVNKRSNIRWVTFDKHIYSKTVFLSSALGCILLSTPCYKTTAFKIFSGISSFPSTAFTFVGGNSFIHGTKAISAFLSSVNLIIHQFVPRSYF